MGYVPEQLLEITLCHRLDGTLSYAEVNVNVIAYGGREVFCIIAHDVTKRKRAGDALRSSMATNRALLNAISDLMFRINRAGIFVNFKAARDNHLHLAADEFLGKHLAEVFPTNVAQLTISCVERALPDW